MSASAAFAIAIVALLMFFSSVVRRMSIFLCWPRNMFVVFTWSTSQFCGIICCAILPFIFSSVGTSVNRSVMKKASAEIGSSTSFTPNSRSASLNQSDFPETISPSSAERPCALTFSIKSPDVGESGDSIVNSIFSRRQLHALKG